MITISFDESELEYVKSGLGQLMSLYGMFPSSPLCQNGASDISDLLFRIDFLQDGDCNASCD